MHSFFLKLISLVLLTVLFGCKNRSDNQLNKAKRTVKVYDVTNAEALRGLSALDLDLSHPNLLDPNISKEDIESVMYSWKGFHKVLGQYLDKHNFDWGINDPTISVMTKIYFEKSGTVSHYAFKVLNPLVDKEKRKEFGDRILEFCDKNSLALEKDFQFAQCGKIAYKNVRVRP